MTSMAPRVHFLGSGAFHADLRRRVDEYFRRTAQSRTGDASMRAKSVVMLAWLVATYTLLLVGNVSASQAVLLAVSLGLAMAGVGFNVMHDANHGSYSRSRRVNAVLGFTADLIGGSSYVWRQKHNVLHHTYTNISGLDSDLDAGPLLRLAPAQRRRGFHRLQAFYVWALYALFPLKWWFFDDFRDLAKGRVGASPFARPRGGALAATAFGKAIFFGWAFVIPVLAHPTWALVPLWLITISTLGITMASVFQLAHCVGDADFLEAPTQGQMATDWATHEVATTVDFARGSWVLGWYLGGLNFQVEHHLFPKVCHVHYPALSPIVEQACRDHGLRFRTEPTLHAALAANLRWLAHMGKPGPERVHPT